MSPNEFGERIEALSNKLGRAAVFAPNTPVKGVTNANGQNLIMDKRVHDEPLEYLEQVRDEVKILFECSADLPTLYRQQVRVLLETVRKKIALQPGNGEQMTLAMFVHCLLGEVCDVDRGPLAQLGTELKVWLQDAPAETETANTDETLPLLQYITLDQAAAIVGRSKKTLERRLSMGVMPQPDVESCGGGTAHEWIYSKLRPWLEREFERQLPEFFPASRIVR